MSYRFNRRYFLKGSALAAGALAAGPLILRAQNTDKVNVAFIGVGGRGGSDLDECVKAGCNVVGLCDIDAKRLDHQAKRFPQAKAYADYRKMLETQKNIEAVMVGTPDHHHFPASMMAIKLGKHVYCEKPLTHSIWEARQVAAAARKAKLATQMGTQGHAGLGIRRLSEWIAAGVIGAVKEVHIWTDRPRKWWPQGVDRPKDTPACPAHISWDEWLGPAPQRPYHPCYLPFNWRGWWDFGTGALGDIGCHSFDLPWTAMKLGNTAPTSVEAISFGGKPESGPLWSDITYQFPAADGRPAFKLFWYDGRNRDTAKDSPEYKSVLKLKELAHMDEKATFPEGGQIYVGEKGTILMLGYPRLVPESAMKGFTKPAETIPPSIGHHAEWLAACKGGAAAGANFDYAGPLAEAVLLGNLAIRLNKKVEWDSANLRCPNAPEADPLIRREYRKGWEV